MWLSSPPPFTGQPNIATSDDPEQPNDPEQPISQRSPVRASATSKAAVVVTIAAMSMAWVAGRYSPWQNVVKTVPISLTAAEPQGPSNDETPDKKSTVRQWTYELNGEIATVAEKEIKPFIDQGDAVAANDVTRVLVDSKGNHFLAITTSHKGPWAFLPAILAVALCLLIREPLLALLGGVVTGGLLLQKYNIVDEVLLPSVATKGGAGILLLYLWLLGTLMGIWSRNGAASAFAQWATDNLVKGPRSAKLVAWALGVLFFQGGTISTVLVGTTVKPVADRQRISHEELSYIVDSTASPIAILVAFNAWPLYVQSLLFVPGFAYLATEANRLEFFFDCLPLSFYAIFAVLGTFLLSIDRAPILGKRMRTAIARARSNGQLDRPGSAPLQSTELRDSRVPEGYQPIVAEFVLPMVVLIGIAIGTFVISGAPKVRVAFALAAVVAAATTLLRGMSLADLLDGIGNGLKGVVMTSVILLLAVTLGSITKETGAAEYLVQSLSNAIPFWILPAMLFAFTLVIAFSTGTSWGTYAVAFPLAMPLALSLARANGLENELLYMGICFATVLNGSVMGDQCSPISDTTVLSAMTTGSDLMDHVLTQIIPASVAGLLATAFWTLLSFCC